MKTSKHPLRIISKDKEAYEPHRTEYHDLGFDSITAHKFLLPVEYEELESRLSSPKFFPENELPFLYPFENQHRITRKLIVSGKLGEKTYNRYSGGSVSLSGSMQRFACGNNIELSSGKTQVELWKLYCAEFIIDPEGWTVSRLEFAFQAMLPYTLKHVSRVAVSYRTVSFSQRTTRVMSCHDSGLNTTNEPTIYAELKTVLLKWYNKGSEASAKGEEGMLSYDDFNLHRIEKTFKKFPHYRFDSHFGRVVTMLDLDDDRVRSFFVNDLVLAILQIRFNDLVVDDSMPASRKTSAFHRDRKLVQDALMSPNITVEREHKRMSQTGRGRRAKKISDTRRSITKKIEHHCYFAKGSMSYFLFKKLYSETSSIAASAWNSRRGKAILLMLEKGDLKSANPTNVHHLPPETSSTAA